MRMNIDRFGPQLNGFRPFTLLLNRCDLDACWPILGTHLPLNVPILPLQQQDDKESQG